MISWSKYYTPKKLSDQIINLIDPTFTPEIILDICAGSCNMLNSAYAKWPKAKYIGIDIEPVKNTNTIESKNLKLYQFDSCHSLSLSKKFIYPKRKLLLANPPFGNYCGLKPKHINFKDNIDIIANNLNRVECHILISNLALLNKGDYFGAILPENFFTSENMKTFKEHFVSYFECIIIKDHKIKFRGSEVKTKIFVAKFIGPRKHKLINILNPQISHSLKLKYQIVRGIDNSILESAKFKGSKEVIHFNNKEGKVLSSKFISQDYSFKEKQKIESQDLLILRVGRNSGKVIEPQLKHYGLLVSDLIIILKNGKKMNIHKQSKLEKLLLNRRKGLTTNYISTNDIWESLEILN